MIHSAPDNHCGIAPMSDVPQDAASQTFGDRPQVDPFEAKADVQISYPNKGYAIELRAAL